MKIQPFKGASADLTGIVIRGHSTYKGSVFNDQVCHTFTAISATTPT